MKVTKIKVEKETPIQIGEVNIAIKLNNKKIYVCMFFKVITQLDNSTLHLLSST